MWLCVPPKCGLRTKWSCSFYLLNKPFKGYTCWRLDEEGFVLWDQWTSTPAPADESLSGVLADWMDDHRDSLLEGAVGQDPAGRLDLLIRRLREVRCWGNESVSG